MSKVNAGWTVVDPKLPLLTYLYSFGPGLANALAVKGERGLIVVSPPCRMPDSAFTELEAHGKVAAIVASNAFHHLGLPAWKVRYPDARVFAPAQSIARVEKKARIAGVEPLSSARDIAGDQVELIDMPHYKTGEILVRTRVAGEIAWYVTDVIMNMPRVPPPPVGLLFKWTGSAPGLRLNGVAPWFMVQDKPALKRWLRAEVEKAPPSLLVPCHGDVLRMPAPGKELLSLFPSA